MIEADGNANRFLTGEKAVRRPVALQNMVTGVGKAGTPDARMKLSFTTPNKPDQ